MVFLHNLTMSEILLRILAALLVSGFAGSLLVALLRLLREPTPWYEGRQRPWSHVTLSGIFLAIAFRATWIQPLPMRREGRDLRPVLAVVAVLAVLLALVPLLDLTRPALLAWLPRSLGYMALAGVDAVQHVLVNSALIGVLPVPGMLMGQALPRALPQIERPWRRWQGFGMAAVAILLILGWFPDTRALVDWLRLV